MTLEEAQAQIVELTSRNEQLQHDNEMLSQNNEQLTGELEKVRTINQDYFNRLTQQNAHPNNPDDNDPEPIPTCEEFALNLNI